MLASSSAEWCSVAVAVVSGNGSGVRSKSDLHLQSLPPSSIPPHRRVYVCVLAQMADSESENGQVQRIRQEIKTSPPLDVALAQDYSDTGWSSGTVSVYP